MNDIWNRRFLELASFISNWSKDPSTKVGAVIVDCNRRIISTGYNGFPIGVSDDHERLENRDFKYKAILHAEENAIMFAKKDLSRCSLYVSSLPPCSHCASLIIQSGIKNVYTWEQEIPERWQESINITKTMFKESGVSLNYVRN
jgi:dCMP deaminase